MFIKEKTFIIHRDGNNINVDGELFVKFRVNWKQKTKANYDIQSSVFFNFVQNFKNSFPIVDLNIQKCWFQKPIWVIGWVVCIKKNWNKDDHYGWVIFFREYICKTEKNVFNFFRGCLPCAVWPPRGTRFAHNFLSESHREKVRALL